VLARLNTGDPLAPTPAQPTTNLGGDWEQAVVMSANDHRVAYVVLAASAFTTPDGGAHWQDITGDLQATDPTNGVARAGRLHSIEYVPSANGDRLFVGGDFGVFMSTVANPTSWVRVGTNFPHAAVFDMKFDAARNVLTVGTVGRSAWQINAPGNLNRPPVALCKDAPVSANGSCQASVTRTDVDNGSFDPDGDSFNCVIDNGGPFGLGPHIVKLTCTDTSGTSSSCNSTVTVNDNTPPVVTCPVSVNVPCTNASGAVASWATSASDACSPPVTPVVCNRVSGSTFPLGNTFVTCTSNDAAGNTGSCLFNVTVALGDNPVCCPAGTNIILGTSNNDPLNGTAGSDCILGRGGQDTINGNGGNDFISGGDGDDIISGGAGNDLIFGGTGQDRITGDAGNDVMSGGDGDDRVSGGDGADVVLGGQGQDQLFGDNGNDTLAGETGDDHLEGGAGADLLIGGGLHDVCIGGPDLDTFLTCQTATQ
jgi:Ca2+-binding RTX toxin-like protein